MTTDTIIMFDASLQKEVEHTIEMDDNGEVVLTSIESGRFVKLPADTTPESLAAYIEAHKSSNEGQITQESIDAKRQELIDGLKQAAPQDVVEETS